MSQFSTTLTVNSLIWVSSLAPDEEGTTRRIHEDLVPCLASIGLPYESFQPESAAELLLILDAIAQAARLGSKPILHFDTHGSAKDGIRIAATGEFVSWPVLAEKLRAINVATENNLCVVSAACFSLHVIKQVKIIVPCPFYILIAPEQEVSFGFIEDNIAKFYRELFDGSDVISAYEKHLSSKVKLFHSEKMFAVALTRYVRDHCAGKGGDKRREDLMTQAFAAGVPRDPKKMPMLRRMIRDSIRPSQDLIDRFTKSFLMGKPAGFGLSDVMKVVRDANAAADKERSRQARRQSRRKGGSKQGQQGS